MAAKDGDPKRALATGVRGEIAMALVRRLRDADWVVEPAERGDDLAELATDVDAVIVLEGTLPTGTDYAMALRAAANAVDRAGVDRLVAVTLYPYTDKQRKGPFMAARRAESALVGAGYPLEVIRAGFLVGSPDLAAPSDPALFASGDTIRYHGNGNQLLRPLLLEDLAAVLHAAVERRRRPEPATDRSPSPASSPGSQVDVSHRDPWAVLAEGPEELSARRLLEKLNPAVTVKPESRRLALALLAVFLAAFVTLVVFSGLELSLLAPVLVLVALAMQVAVVKKASSGFYPATLPSENFRLRDRAPPLKLLDVPLRKVTDVWDAAAFARRGPRRELDQGAKRYGVTPGSRWVAGFLMCFAAGAGAVGFHDLFLTALSTGARLTALALCVVAGMTAFGCVALLTRWPSRYAVGFIASVVCVATLIIVPVTAAAGGDPSAWNLLGFYFVPPAVWCCVHLWKRGGLQVKNVLATRGEKLFGSVVVGGSLATVAQLLYGSVYLPATAKPSVSGEIQLAVAADRQPAQAAHNDPAMLAATVKLRNDADRPLVVLAAFQVVDARAIDAPKGCRKGREGSAQLGDRPSARTVLIERDTLLPSGSRLEPSELVTKRLVVPTRRNSSVAAMRVDLAVARPRYRHDEPWTVCVRPNGTLHYVARIEDHTWLHDITRSARYVHVVRTLQGDLGCTDHRQFVAYVDGQSETSAERWCGKRTQLAEHYGLATEQFSAEVPIR